MKSVKILVVVTTLMMVVGFGCSKATDVAATASGVIDSTLLPPKVGGATTDYKDTVSISVGDVTILYSKTSACYPSNEIFAFTAIAKDLPANTIYQWNFGDGHTANGAATVGNIYQETGYYTVQLTITNAAKQPLKIISVSVYALGQQVTPHASFYAQVFDVNYPNNYHFNANSSNVPRSKIINYNWSWGDSSNEQTVSPDNIQHNFPKVPFDKTYPVQLVVTAKSGCKDTTVVPVPIKGVYSVTGGFNAVRHDSCTNEYFTFTSQAIGIPTGADIAWDFDEGTLLQYGNPINHQYTNDGTKSVKMKVFYKGNLIGEIVQPVIIYGQNIRPKALIQKSKTSISANWEEWNCYSQSFVPHGGIVNNFWDFGDGQIDNANNTSVYHKFNKANNQVTYPIKLIVTGSLGGCTDTAITYITIPAL